MLVHISIKIVSTINFYLNASSKTACRSNFRPFIKVLLSFFIRSRHFFLSFSLSPSFFLSFPVCPTQQRKRQRHRTYLRTRTAAVARRVTTIRTTTTTSTFWFQYQLFVVPTLVLDSFKVVTHLSSLWCCTNSSEFKL